MLLSVKIKAPFTQQNKMKIRNKKKFKGPLYLLRKDNSTKILRPKFSQVQRDIGQHLGDS